MAAPRFHQGDTLSLALRADPRDGGTHAYTVYVMQMRRYADGTRYQICRPNGTCVYLWDTQLAKLLSGGIDRELPPQTRWEAAIDRPA
jgi:hypothetical protein